jgi:hypothetical protein
LSSNRRQLGAQFLFKVPVLLSDQWAKALLNGSELLLGGAPVGSQLTDLCFNLFFESRNPNHEKLIKVGAENGAKFQPL